MDNKQDKQFYWEVKDFLGKNHQANSSKVSKPESLKECISKTIMKNDALYRPSIIPPAPLTEDIISSVNSLLSLNENHIKSNSNNITSNMFNLTEAPAPPFGGGSLSGGPGRSFDSSRRPGSGSSWRDRNPEEYQQNVEMRLARQREAEENRRQVATDSRRRRSEDEAYEYSQAMKDKGADAQLEMDSKNPSMAADTAANRAKLRDYRTTRDTEKQASYYSDVIANTAKKDPSQLTAREAADLAMAKIVMRGGGEGSLSKGNKDLEARIQTRVGEKLGKSPISQEVDPNINQQQADIDALAAAKMTPQDAAAGAAARTRAKDYFAGDNESSFKLSREKTAEDVKAKAEQARIDAEKMKEDHYQSMKDKVVRGTNMTLGEFEAMTGRRFNSSDPRDSSLISRLAGAASRGRSETAKQLDLTTDAFNARYDAQNKDLAQRQGTADRAADQSQFESDKFKNDPAYRKQVQDAETAKLMPRVKAQIAADEAKRVAAENAGKEQAKRDITRTNLANQLKQKEADELKQKEADEASQRGVERDEYRRSLEKSEVSVPFRQTGYPIGDDTLVTRPSAEFSDANVAKAAGIDFSAGRNNTAPPSIRFTASDKLNAFRDAEIAKTRADRDARIRSNLPPVPRLLAPSDEVGPPAPTAAERARENTEKNLRTASTIIQSRKPENTPGVSFRDSVQGPPSPQNAEAGAQAQDNYVSLINSFTGRTPIEPGSKENIEDQLKKLNRGQ
jgi:hypothetical protein